MSKNQKVKKFDVDYSQLNKAQKQSDKFDISNCKLQATAILMVKCDSLVL